MLPHRPVPGLRQDHIINMAFGRVRTITDVSVTASDDSSVTVQFTEVSDGLGGLVDYEVYVREKGVREEWTLQATDFGTTIGATKTIKAEQLDPGKTWELQVRAIDVKEARFVRSFWSNVVEQATSSGDVPQPTGLSTVSVALGQVDLSWTDNGGTGFSIERRTPPGEVGEPEVGGEWAEIDTTGDGVNTYDDIFAFVLGVSYEWRVFATDGEAKSAPSNTISATPVVEEPTAPGSISLTHDAGSTGPDHLDIFLDSVADDGTGSPASIVVRFWESADANPAWGFHAASEFVQSMATHDINDQIQFTVRFLDANTEYQVQATAFRGTLNVDAVFSATLSNVVTQTTDAGSTPPLAPSGLSVVVDSTQQITHSWTDEASDETSQSIKERNETDGGSFAEIENVAANIETKIHDRGSVYPSGKRFQAQVVAEKTGSDDSDPSNAVLYTPNPFDSPPDKFPNEPAGFTPIFEHECKVIPDGTNGLLQPDRWRNNNYGNHLTVVSDSTAPLSGPDVLDFRYPAGLRAGDWPAKFYLFTGGFGGPEYEEFYCSLRFKFIGPDWETPPTSQKFWYVKHGHGSGPFYSNKSKFPNGSIQPDFGLRWADANQVFVSSGRPIKMDQWHHVEVRTKHNTIDVADGEVRVWLDNVLEISRSDILIRATGKPAGWNRGYRNWEFTPVYGGTGYTKTREDHFRIDHIYGSGKTII